MVAHLADHTVGDNVADRRSIGVFLCDATTAGCVCACAQRHL